MDFKNLINLGYTAANILDALSGENPKFGRKVKKLMTAGYAANSILNYLSGGNPKDDDSYITLEEQTKRGVERNQKKEMVNAGLTAAALAAGAYGLGRLGVSALSTGASTLGQGAQAIAQGAASQVPSASTPPLMPNPPIPAPVQPQAPNPLSVQGIQAQAQQLGSQPSQPNTAPVQPQAPTGPPIPEIDFYQTKIHKDFPEIEAFVLKHKDAGIPEEDTYQQLLNSRKLKPIVDKYENDSGQPFTNAINQIYNKPSDELIFPEKIIDLKGMGSSMSDNLYSQLFDSLSQGKDTMAGVKDPVLSFAKPYFDLGEIKSPEDLKNLVDQKYGKNFPIEKGSKVITPEGKIGDITHQKDDTSIINEGDRRSKAKTKDLIPLPKEWENIHVDLSNVPEKDRSSPLQEVVVYPDKKVMMIKFHEEGTNSKWYVYTRKDGKPIDAETLQSLEEESDVAVSSGMSFFGNWEKGGKSRGSAFHHRIKMMSQSDDQKNDPSKPLIFSRAPIIFKHGFYQAYEDELHKSKKEFNDFHKKNKKV